MLASRDQAGSHLEQLKFPRHAHVEHVLLVAHHRAGGAVAPPRVAVVHVQAHALVLERKHLDAGTHAGEVGARGHGHVALAARVVVVVGDLAPGLQVGRGLVVDTAHHRVVLHQVAVVACRAVGHVEVDAGLRRDVDSGAQTHIVDVVPGPVLIEVGRPRGVYRAVVAVPHEAPAPHGLVVARGVVIGVGKGAAHHLQIHLVGLARGVPLHIAAPLVAGKLIGKLRDLHDVDGCGVKLPAPHQHGPLAGHHLPVGAQAAGQVEPVGLVDPLAAVKPVEALAVLVAQAPGQGAPHIEVGNGALEAAGAAVALAVDLVEAVVAPGLEAGVDVPRRLVAGLQNRRAQQHRGGGNECSKVSSHSLVL